MSRRRGTGGSPGCLAVFALPFLAVGLGVGGYAAFTAVRAFRARDWPRVPATLLDARLVTTPGSDTATRRVTARYTYTYLGRSHSGDRVGFHGGADNLGSYHERLFRRLDAARRAGEPVPCYVDPADPSRAVLDPGLRVELLLFMGVFAAVFGGAGAGLLAAGLRGSRRERETARRERDHPGEPWRWRADWDAGRVRSSSRASAAAALAFAALWNAVSLPLLLVLPREMAKGNRAAAVGFLFPAVGAALAVWAVRARARRRKFGDSVFEMASVPGVVGGPLAGLVRVPVNVRPEDGFTVRVSAVHRYVTGTGKNRSTREDIRWQAERHLAREVLDRDFSQTAVPVLFHVPFDQPPTTPGGGSDRILWRLDVEARVPGIDYAARFEVPVFRTAESSPDFVPDERGIRPFLAEHKPQALLGDAGIRVLPGSGGRVVLEAGMGRNPAMLAGLGLFTAIWTAVVVVLVRVGAPLLFPVVFGLFDLLLIAGLLGAGLERRRVEAGREGLRLRGGPLGLGGEVFVAAGDLEDVVIEPGMRSGSRVYYDVKAVTTAGRRRLLARSLPGRDAAEAHAQAVRDALDARP